MSIASVVAAYHAFWTSFQVLAVSFPYLDLMNLQSNKGMDVLNILLVVQVFDFTMIENVDVKSKYYTGIKYEVVRLLVLCSTVNNSHLLQHV